MSTSTAAAHDAVSPTDEEIAAWLTAHPDFFVRNSGLLTTLRLPHASGGVISLIERQIEVLREKNHDGETRLAELVSIARGNEQLVAKIHEFTRRLMRASTSRAVLVQMEAAFRENFEVSQTVLLLFGTVVPNSGDLRFVRQVAASDSNLAGFESLLSSGRPRCGQIRDTQRDFIFGADSVNVGSVALVPLTTPTPLGLLVLGSPNRDRFHPGVSTDFLAHLGELIGDALARD
ncbi:MAG: DUF484 family protein [Pseudomonadota bacterium]